jgi:hypothetical protein
MTRTVLYTICSVLMLGVWWLCKTAIVSTSADFSNGLLVGFFTATFLIWLAEKVDPSH